MKLLSFSRLAELFESQRAGLNLPYLISDFQETIAPFLRTHIFITEEELKGCLDIAFMYTIADMREYQNDTEEGGPKQVFDTDFSRPPRHDQELIPNLINAFFDSAKLDSEATFQQFIIAAKLEEVFPEVWAIPIPVPESPIA